MSALRNINSVMKSGGILAIYVPAFMGLYSNMDFRVGHYRRYHKQELQQKVQEAGFSVMDCHFVDSLGFFASLAVKIFGYDSGCLRSSDKEFAAYDKYIYPVSNWLDRIGAKYLLGKNLILIARKP